jgi:hypothetical protein
MLGVDVPPQLAVGFAAETQNVMVSRTAALTLIGFVIDIAKPPSSRYVPNTVALV